MSSFESLEFEGHGFVLHVSPLWLSSVFEDVGDFLESLVEDFEVIVSFHVFLWALYYYSGKVDEYCFCYGVMLCCESICFIVTCFNPRFPVYFDLSGAIVVDGCLQFVRQIGYCS